jgi:N-acetylglucosaminyldiphosphoundecaprenol N-acetyl-beta-D-mannosaminyltransferase
MNGLVDQRQILGINFYVGDARSAVGRMAQGGLLVVPAAPALKDLASNAMYREALVNSDTAIADSAFMVMVWNLLQRDSIPRLSGLAYLRELLRQPDVRRPGNTLWVMAGTSSAQKNLEWLDSQGIRVPSDCVYEAPIYGTEIEDKALIERLQKLRPSHVVVTIGGGKQERLGLYLKRNLGYLPAIHCIGAAIAFLSGDQVKIPGWADRLYLGWLFRCISEPRRYIPRYLSAPQLAPLIWRYRDRLPVSHDGKQSTAKVGETGRNLNH